MEKVISYGQVYEIKKGKNKNGNDYVILKVNIRSGQYTFKRTYITNWKVAMDNILKLNQGETVLIEASIGKITTYTGEDGQVNASLNFNLTHIESLDNYSTTARVERQREQENFELDLSDILNNDKDLI